MVCGTLQTFERGGRTEEGRRASSRDEMIPFPSSEGDRPRRTLPATAIMEGREEFMNERLLQLE